MTPVYVVTLEGREDPAGAALTVLAFVTAETEDAALGKGEAELRELGWFDIAAQRAGEITDRDALPADFQNALAQTDRWGSALIIYDET